MPVDLYFDLDGTLTDPFEGISKSILHALERCGAPTADEATLRDCIGPPLVESFRRLVGDDRADDAVIYYRERFADVGWRENVLYAGITEVLEGLQKKGHRLFVATSKPHVYAERIIEHFELSDYFTRVFGSELDGTRNDKGELLNYALGIADSANATMIGDR